MKKIIRFGEMRNNFVYIFLNYFVNRIPFWTIRKGIYRLFGMRIGRGSRIMMRCVVLSPENICIGERTIINEYCLIDGRGKLNIGNDCAISNYSKLITGSHDYRNMNFKYITDAIDIGNNVWVCTSAIITAPSNLNDMCVIGAGSVFHGEAKNKGIYVGNPAKIHRYRELNVFYKQNWSPYFR